MTWAAGGLTLGTMASRLQRLDPERRRKRLEVIADRAGVTVQRNRALRLREIIAVRRRSPR